MNTTAIRKPTRRRKAAMPRSREAERLERTYRELGFVYSGAIAPSRDNNRDWNLAPVDFRPRVELTFSALSAQ